MNYQVFSGENIYIISDITSGIFLTALALSTIVRHAVKRMGLPHLFAAIMLILAGVFERFFALMMGIIPDGVDWRPMLGMPLPRSADVVWIMAFILILVGICASVVHTIYVNEGADRSVFRPILMQSGLIATAGIIVYMLSGSINAFTLAALLQLICLNIYLSRSRYKRAAVKYRRASIVAMVTFAIPLAFGTIRLTGLGLSLMLLILNEQYHERIGQELAEKEAALAKSRLQLLTEQISPHYIYNSLQSIRDLCGNDPEKARDAVDAFSEYLRGNLESLTREDLIPFIRELEHTRSYLELEKIAGRRKFDVEYDLETTDFMLPALVLEPLVENAIKHGAGGRADGLMITIATRETEDAVCIEVTDRPDGSEYAGAGYPAAFGENGVERHESTDSTKVLIIEETDGDALKTVNNRPHKRSVGLENVRTRIALQCGGTLYITSAGEGTKAAIMLPKPQNTASDSERR